MFAKELFENVPETLTIPQCPPETIAIVFLDEEVKEVSWQPIIVWAFFNFFYSSSIPEPVTIRRVRHFYPSETVLSFHLWSMMDGRCLAQEIPDPSMNSGWMFRKPLWVK